MTSKPQAFLYSGYTFEQEQSLKQTRETERTRRFNPVVCAVCGKGGMTWRSTSRTYRCRNPLCHHIQSAAIRYDP